MTLRHLAVGLLLTAAIQTFAQDSAPLVDDLIARMLRNQFGEREQKALIEQGGDAVPQLLHHLNGQDANRQLAALAMLQYVWSPAAIEPVAGFLTHKTDQYVHFAAICLLRHAPQDKQGKILRPLLNHNNPEFAAQALRVLEPIEPDVERMAKFIRSRKRRKYAAIYLPRYHSPKLTARTLKMLADKSPESRRAAIASLIHQNAAASAVRKQVGAMFRDRDAGVRDRAAEYFMWHGRSSDLRGLQQVLTKATDSWERASIQAAIVMVQRRHDLMQNDNDNAYLEIGAKDFGTDKYSKALRLLQENPLPKAWKPAFALYRTAEPFEPYWRYAVSRKPTAAFRRRCVRRRLLQARLFGFPDHETQDQKYDYGAEGKIPLAERFMPPVRDYFDAKRKSFGRVIPPHDGPFANSVHVGDDCAWNEDHATVVSIAAGRVRAAWSGLSWGGIVVIEHRRNGSSFCSLYGHLSPFLLVVPGQTVNAGQKIGSLGRRHTWANGGYGTHLHFGIYRGSFGQGDWISGYLAKDRFSTGRHGWQAPQAFLKRRE